MRWRWLTAASLVVAACGAPGDAAGTGASPTTPAVGWWSPSPGVTWQIQLQGEIDLGIEAEVYDIDLFDTPVGTIDELHRRGRRVVCYLSAGSHEDWRPDAADYPDEILGAALIGRPGERWIDVRRIDLVGPQLAARLDLAVSKGCDAVDPDNVDGYANASGFDLSAADQLAFNRWLADQAHVRGLGVGLKNDLAQIPDLVGWFDFAVNEECFVFHECELLMPMVTMSKAVLAIEYSDNLSSCARADDLGLSLVFKDLDLTAAVTRCP